MLLSLGVLLGGGGGGEPPSGDFLFIPSGSDSLITSDGDTFNVNGA